MTVTIHKPVGCPPQQMAALTRLLVSLAGGDRRAVRSGHGGLVVSDAVALAYLTSAAPPVPGDDAPASQPVPPNLARVVRGAENAAGMTTPRQPAATAEPKKTANVVTRRRAARVQEPDHV
jgi:hypothetical protein